MTSIVLYAALATVAGWGDRPAMIRMGGDPAAGLLFNVTAGRRRDAPPDPGCPTVVFIHGFNPLPRTVHFEMAEHLGAALARRAPGFNVLGWDWNAATFVGLRGRDNQGSAVAQGVLLAEALLRAGVDPARTHLVGHSSGAIVATAAARSLGARTGRAVAQLTLLDPARLYHALVFDRLAAGTAALRVENYWTPGPSGFGCAVEDPGIWNRRIDGPTPYLGIVAPNRSAHFGVVHWYFGTAADPAEPNGFGTSLLLRPAGG